MSQFQDQYDLLVIYVWPRMSAQKTFTELADAFVEVLGKKYRCWRSPEFTTNKNTLNIILGANDSLFTPRDIPDNSIIVNLEQLGVEGSVWNDKRYIDLLKRFPVWDYSDSNIEYLTTQGITAEKFYIGYTASLETCNPFLNPNTRQDIDVLFFGALNQRRKTLLYKLQGMSLNVHYTCNSFGGERDKLIARSKIILNIHYYDSKLLEVVRIAHLLANKKCVISEAGSEEPVNKLWSEGVVMCSYDEIVSNTLIYLYNNDKRQQQEQAGYDFITRNPLQLPL